MPDHSRNLNLNETEELIAMETDNCEMVQNLSPDSPASIEQRKLHGQGWTPVLSFGQNARTDGVCKWTGNHMKSLAPAQGKRTPKQEEVDERVISSEQCRFLEVVDPPGPQLLKYHNSCSAQIRTSTGSPLELVTKFFKDSDILYNIINLATLALGDSILRTEKKLAQLFGWLL
ncbi:hypothetical protein Q9966_010063 [Columba livia]|nr:hypothetical protein Q9966_010063 [Columba livia]